MALSSSWQSVSPTLENDKRKRALVPCQKREDQKYHKSNQRVRRFEEVNDRLIGLTQVFSFFNSVWVESTPEKVQD